METPVLQEARELIPDAGVAGKYRGGLGEELILGAFNRPACQPDSPRRALLPSYSRRG